MAPLRPPLDWDATTSSGLPDAAWAELDELAAAGDPDAPLPDDAVPLDLRGEHALDMLPDWYMPAPAIGAGQLRGWRRRVAWLIVAGSLAVVSSGLCNTYGILEIA